MADTLRVGPDTDRPAVIEALAQTNLDRKRARGETGDIETSRIFAAGRLGPAFAAADMGHTVMWDPPTALTSVRGRWTCVGCGQAVLQAATRTAPQPTTGATPRRREPEPMPGKKLVTVTNLQDVLPRIGGNGVLCVFTSVGPFGALKGREAKVYLTNAELAKALGALPALAIPEDIQPAFFRVLRWLSTEAQ